jgi:hypothetical protein
MSCHDESNSGKKWMTGGCDEIQYQQRELATERSTWSKGVWQVAGYPDYAGQSMAFLGVWVEMTALNGVVVVVVVVVEDHSSEAL